MAEKKRIFEESLKKLEEASENLKSTDISLEDAIKCYDQGIKYYNECREILDNANQRIETINK